MPTASFRTVPLLLLASLAVVLAGCPADDDARRGLTRDRGPSEGTPAPLRGQEYTRRLVFVSAREDTALVVPFSFRAVAGERSVAREMRGGLAHRGIWETFAEERWETPPTRAPWRLHPRGGVRLLVGDDDRLEAILYREGGRGLEIGLDEELVEWGGGPDETYRIVEGGALLSGRQIPGFVVDVSHARETGGGGPGGIAFLVSGDSLLLVLDEPPRDAGDGSRPGTPDRSQEFGGWVWIADEGELPLDPVQVEWLRQRPFEEARRDVPTEWRLSGTGRPSLRGRLQTRVNDLVAGEGEGPLLPVEGDYQVDGTVILRDRSYPVHGYLRHVQP